MRSVIELNVPHGLVVTYKEDVLNCGKSQMMLTKKVVNQQINSLPEEFTLDELIEKLIVVDKVNLGLKDLEEGRTLSEDELDKRMAKWFV